MRSLFVRLTFVVALALVGLFVLVFVLKVVLMAAVVAAFAVGGVLLMRLVQRRRSKRAVVQRG